MAVSTLIQEDGSAKSNSNSYVTAAQISQFAEDQGVTLAGTYTTTILAYRAMEYLERFDFIGVKYTEAQALQWPRSGAWIDGYQVDIDEIPQELIDAQLAIALAIDEGYDPLANVDRQAKREKIDVIEIEYMDGAAATPFAKRIAPALRKLVHGGQGASQFRTQSG